MPYLREAHDVVECTTKPHDSVSECERNDKVGFLISVDFETGTVKLMAGFIYEKSSQGASVMVLIAHASV